MRIFISPEEALNEIKRDLWEMGTRYQSTTVQDKFVENDPGYQTIELMGYSYMITKFSDMEVFLSKGKANRAWVRAEIVERLSLPFRNPGVSWKQDEAIWKPFLRDGFFSYTYAERWQEQIPYVINELLRRPNSRQAMITMYDRHQDMMNWGGRDRVPCSVSYQFMIREGKLNVIYNQRSCDFIHFFPADVYFTIELLKHIAEAINVPVGYFVHFLGSLHAFSKDLAGENIF